MGGRLTKGSIVLTGASGIKLALSLKNKNPAGVLIAVGLMAAGSGLSRLALRNISGAGDKLLMVCLGRETIANRVAELYKKEGQHELAEFIQKLGKERIKGNTSKERNKERKKLLNEKRDKLMELVLESELMFS